MEAFFIMYNINDKNTNGKNQSISKRFRSPLMIILIIVFVFTVLAMINSFI